MRAFSFLGDHYVVMVLMQDDPVEEDVRPVMNVWDTRSAANGDAVRVDEANFVRSFRFPTLSDRAHLTEITIRSDPAPQWSPSSETQAPFYLARSAKLYVVTFWVILGNNARGITVFIPAATLLKRVTSADAATVVDWESWGPRGSLLLKSWIHPGSVWVCYVYGEKYVSFHPAGENTQSVVVFDFNEAAALRSGPMPEQPSVYKEKNIFEDEVVTNIPYRATLCRIQSGPAHGMCSEDAILLVDVRSLNLPQTRSFGSHVHTSLAIDSIEFCRFKYSGRKEESPGWARCCMTSCRVKIILYGLFLSLKLSYYSHLSVLTRQLGYIGYYLGFHWQYGLRYFLSSVVSVRLNGLQAVPVEQLELMDDWAGGYPIYHQPSLILSDNGPIENLRTTATCSINLHLPFPSHDSKPPILYPPSFRTSVSYGPPSSRLPPHPCRWPQIMSDPDGEGVLRGMFISHGGQPLSTW